MHNIVFKEQSCRVLGIDPGLNKTGFGIIDVIGNQHLYQTSGVILTNSKEQLYQRIRTIVTSVIDIIKEYKPNVTSIEKVFVNINPNSTLLLGQARGAAMAGCTLLDIPVYEYTALQVKKAIVGYGHANKIQVGLMVQRLLNLSSAPKNDAADALAIALTHVFTCKTQNTE